MLLIALLLHLELLLYEVSYMHDTFSDIDGRQECSKE